METPTCEFSPLTLSIVRKRFVFREFFSLPLSSQRKTAEQLTRRSSSGCCSVISFRFANRQLASELVLCTCRTSDHRGSYIPDSSIGWQEVVAEQVLLARKTLLPRTEETQNLSLVVQSSRLVSTPSLDRLFFGRRSGNFILPGPFSPPTLYRFRFPLPLFCHCNLVDEIAEAGPDDGILLLFMLEISLSLPSKSFEWVGRASLLSQSELETFLAEHEGHARSSAAKICPTPIP